MVKFGCGACEQLDETITLWNLANGPPPDPTKNMTSSVSSKIYMAVHAVDYEGERNLDAYSNHKAAAAHVKAAAHRYADTPIPRGDGWKVSGGEYQIEEMNVYSTFPHEGTRPSLLTPEDLLPLEELVVPQDTPRHPRGVCGTTPGMSPALQDAFRWFLGDYDVIKAMGDECPAGTVKQLWESWEFLIRPIYSDFLFAAHDSGVALRQKEIHFEASKKFVEDIEVVEKWITNIAGVRLPSPVTHLKEEDRITVQPREVVEEGEKETPPQKQWICPVCKGEQKGGMFDMLLDGGSLRCNNMHVFHWCRTAGKEVSDHSPLRCPHVKQPTPVREPSKKRKSQPRKKLAKRKKR